MERLSARIDASRPSGLNYYLLPGPGERFPLADAAFAPGETPRPADDAAFLHGLLEGVARIEALGYHRLAEVGAPPVPAASEEAAVGAAALGLRAFGPEARTGAKST